MCRAERGFRFDDPTLAIRWPIQDSIVSDRDRSLPPEQLPGHQAVMPSLKVYPYARIDHRCNRSPATAWLRLAIGGASPWLSREAI